MVRRGVATIGAGARGRGAAGVGGSSRFSCRGVAAPGGQEGESGIGCGEEG
jgi:hypothetical protein